MSSPKSVVNDVELAEDGSVALKIEATHPPTTDRLLLEAFIGARNRARGPLVAISDRTMITNSGASEILEPGDRRMLWDWVQSIQGDDPTVVGSFLLNNGIKVTARCRVITENGSPAGAVMRLGLDAVRLASRDVGLTSLESVGLRSSKPLDSTVMRGWGELTDAERTVAEHVSRGLTNKEVGRQMFLSRHTIDSHLRQVFRKLGINSRVELARLLGEHYETLNERSAERSEVANPLDDMRVWSSNAHAREHQEHRDCVMRT
ncbi:MAG TPA: helix-turn-helix transcriptional regulator [Acidimicrobiales bacterium]|nr:helix-turn-helix transcriptional regulator [Acidimicrobiales bacterium]